MLFAQTLAAPAGAELVGITGRVTNDHGIPIVGACVTVFDENHAFLKNTQTDADGNYELSLAYYSSYNFYVKGAACGDQGPALYFPARQRIQAPTTGELQVDFRLRPAGYLVVQAYDNSGTLLGNKAFETTTAANAFATDLNDIPYYAELNRAQGAAWEAAPPTFIVLPEARYKFWVLWEVPGFGKVMLAADNEGDGYSISRAGEQVTINFNYEAARSKCTALEKDYNSLKSQGYRISDSVVRGLDLSKEHLATAEKLFQTPASEMKNAVAELNTSLKEALWAHERLYLDRAEADIDKYRKGEVTIKVTEEGGKPAVGATISFTQTSRDFLFAVAASPHDGKAEYRDLLKQAGINCIYTYFAYGGVEPTPGIYNWRAGDNQVTPRLNEGFKLIGMLSWLFYRAPWDTSGQSCPPYLDDMSFEEIKKNVYEHNYALAQRYRGKVDIWEAIAEPCMFNQYDWTWNQRLELYHVAASAIKDANPEAQIMTWNPSLSYLSHRSFKLPDLDLGQPAPGLPGGNVQDGIPYQEFLRLAMENGVPIDVVGLHFINAGVDVYVQPRNIHPGLDLTSISDMIDQYSAFGKPLFFREHHAPSKYIEGGNWWHRLWDEETQAEYVREFYTLAFAKPNLEGIGWSTGFTDDVAQMYGCISGGMLYDNLNPKPSYFAFKDLVDSWTTQGSGKTDDEGEYVIRGFAGDYNISITTPEGKSIKKAIHIVEREANAVNLQIPDPRNETTAPQQVDSGTSGTDKSSTDYPPIIVWALGGLVLLVLTGGVIALRKRLHSR